jgi:ADP-ribosylglycohydrolase
MSTAAVSSSYYSLEPSDALIWKKGGACCCLGKLALGVVAVIALPLEMLGRLFANLAIAVSRLFRADSLSVRSRESCLSDVANAIFIAENSLPAQKLTQQVVHLKVCGTFYGQVIGDALGMFTEFLNKDEAQKLRPQELEFSDRSKFRRQHVNRFPMGGWTDDSDQFFMIGRSDWESFLGNDKTKEVLMAHQLYNWRQHGLNGFTSASSPFFSRQDNSSTDPYRKQIGCQGLGALTSDVLNHPDFLTDPHKAALAVWKKGDKNMQERPAANGALMRTAILGPIYRNDLGQAVAEAIRYAKVTHADPRCIASAVALTAAIVLLHAGANGKDAFKHAETIAVKVLWEEMSAVKEHVNAAEKDQWQDIAKSFENELRQCMHDDLATLKLGEGLIGYTFKCLGAAFYALRRAMAMKGMPESIFRTVLEEIIFEAGDADTNGAAAGALLGAYLGENAIPESWRTGLHSQDQKILRETLVHANMIASAAAKTEIHA